MQGGITGENGPIAFGLADFVAPEFDNQDADDFTIEEQEDGSVVLRGVWEESDNTSIPLSNFVSELRTTEAASNVGLYWNVHTEEFPGGEIRGQLQIAETPRPEPIFGSTGDDVQEAGVNLDSDRDLIFSGSGNDLVDTSTGAGSNRLYGGSGDDELFVGEAERAFGGAGKDILDAGGKT